MPPAIFVASAAGAIVGQAIAFEAPATMRRSDTLLAIVAAPNANDGPDLDALEDWDELGELVGATFTIWILRRAVEDGERSHIEIPFLEAIPSAIGALLVMRGLDNGAAAGSASISAVAASTDFVCPSRVLARYSDVYIGIALVTSAAVAVAPPASGTERIEVQGGGLALEAFTVLPEVVGATGTKTATTAAAQSGNAASIAIATTPLVGQGKTFNVSPVGTIGLPSRGV